MATLERGGSKNVFKDVRTGNGSKPRPVSGLDPPWSRVEGKYLVNFQGMLPDAGGILRGIHFWEVPFALMLSPGWGDICLFIAGRGASRLPWSEEESILIFSKTFSCWTWLESGPDGLIWLFFSGRGASGLPRSGGSCRVREGPRVPQLLLRL